MEQKILSLIKTRGPLTGKEILDAIGGDGLLVWRVCNLSSSLEIRTVGTHYLRLDRNVDGYARLSPSVLRGFLTYSVIGFKEDPDILSQRVFELISHMEKVSRAKLDLAFRIASSILSRFESECGLEDGVCFIIAGDIVYNMAHDVPRPERSTKKMVRGSDMDLVVIVDDALPDSFLKNLDDAIYREKCGLLMAPHLKEELDYVVKRMARVREQVRFDTFKHMVACKILHEGTLLCGSENLFTGVKAMLRESGVDARIAELAERASVFRREAEAQLLYEDLEEIQVKRACLFYPTEESEEFE
jgi:hypothetical protein